MNQPSTQTSPTKWEKTQRKDDWVKYPTLVAIGFSLFGLYATYRAFFGAGTCEAGNLLSPFYSPKLSFSWWPLSPALLILPVPLLFRSTCYYYRKAYYRAFFGTPQACAVTGTANPNYSGETKFPWVFQNIHRYAFYLAAVVLAILWWDAIVTLFAAEHFFEFKYLQVSVGTLVYFANVYLLSGYTFGCHACRHLVGGCNNSFTATESAKAAHTVWEKITLLNERHEIWAWASLFSVGFADFYTWGVAAKWWPDYILLAMPH